MHTISIAKPSQIAKDLPEVVKTKSMLWNKNKIVCLTSYWSSLFKRIT